jgi:hypothetical protein
MRTVFKICEVLRVGRRGCEGSHDSLLFLTGGRKKNYVNPIKNNME